MPKGSPTVLPRPPETRVVCLRGFVVLLLSLLFAASAQAQLTLNRYINGSNAVIPVGSEFPDWFVATNNWVNNGFTNFSGVSVTLALSSVGGGNVFEVGETAAFLYYNVGDLNEYGEIIYDYDPTNTATALTNTFVISNPGSFTSPGVDNEWQLAIENSEFNIGDAILNYWRLILTGDAVTNGTISVGQQGIISASPGYTVNGATISIVGSGTNGVTVTNSSALTFNGGLTGSGDLNKIGSGTLSVGGNSSGFTGNFRLNEGSVNLTTNTALGSGVLIQSNGSSTAVFSGGGTYTQNMSLYNASFANGGNTLSGSITNNGNGTFTGASGTTNTITGVIRGTGGFTKEGAGTIMLRGSADNTYSGATVVNAGSLVLSNSGGSAIQSSSSITVNSGGTLVLGASNQIGDSINLVLNGGTLLVGASNLSETLGTLTLNASSTIDFGNFGATGLRQLTFSTNTANITWTGTLTITNWQGVANATSDFTDLIFGVGGLNTNQLAQIRFANQGNATGTLLGGELVPVPEPQVYAAALALLAFVGWRERKRIASLVGFSRES
ncbi:MAG: beta strand repeat-containing protein [Chthoniobacterales bacterium]